MQNEIHFLTTILGPEIDGDEEEGAVEVVDIHERVVVASDDHRCHRRGRERSAILVTEPTHAGAHGVLNNIEGIIFAADP